jgi:hypothetical protein
VHFRRYFDEALKGAKNTPGTMSKEALERINRLFAIERELARLTPRERLAERDRLSRPLAQGFHKWMDDLASGCYPRACSARRSHTG